MLLYPVVFVPLLYHVRTSNDYFENGARNQFKNKGNAG